MERQLFEWEGWDQHNTMVFGFHSVKLAIDIGVHKAGTNFPYANIDYDKGVLELFTDPELKNPPEKYKLNIVIVRRIDV